MINVVKKGTGCVQFLNCEKNNYNTNNNFAESLLLSVVYSDGAFFFVLTYICIYMVQPKSILHSKYENNI